jgi:membrane-associated phospholipid phosphatase
MKERLLETDYLWFYTVHFEWVHPILDIIAPFVRNPLFWAPLYLFLAFFAIINYGKRGIYWCLFYIMTVSFSDFTAAKIFKAYFQRIRPCNDELFSDIIRGLVNCGSGYSFPSNHATNHFAMAMFIIFTISGRNPFTIILCILWAAMIAYAQVYVGVHYPFDVIVGAIYGSLIGIFFAKLFNKYIKLRLPVRKKNAPPVGQYDSDLFI